MFNSPINKLFGIPPVGQDNKQQHGKKDNDDSQKEKKNLFKDEENTLYTDISSESFDIEGFVNKFFENLKNKEQSEKTNNRIEKFLTEFDINKFKYKYGEKLSKEDLSIILYSIAEKLGVKL